MDEEAAATKIQAAYRGKVGRDDVAFQRRMQEDARRIHEMDGVDDLLLGLLDEGDAEDEADGTPSAAGVCGQPAGHVGARSSADNLLAGLLDDEGEIEDDGQGFPPSVEEAAATRLQAAFRGHHSRAAWHGEKQRPPDPSQFSRVLAARDGPHGLGVRPSSDLRVPRVAPGTWAARVGVLPGDELLALDGYLAAEMADDAFEEAMASERPLRLSFVRAAASTLAPPREQSKVPAQGPRQGKAGAASAKEPRLMHGRVEVGTDNLGWSPVSLRPKGPLGPVAVKKVAADGWASQIGVEKGDELALVDGQSPDGLEKHELIALLKRRPVDLTFRRAAAGSPAAAVRESSSLGAPRTSDRQLDSVRRGEGPAGASGGHATRPPSSGRLSALVDADARGAHMSHDVFTVVATEADPGGEMGWVPEMGTGEGGLVEFMRVQSVELGSWAARKGLAPGDELLMANSLQVVGTHKKALKAEIRSARPLRLKFRSAVPLKGRAGAAELEPSGARGGSSPARAAREPSIELAELLAGEELTLRLEEGQEGTMLGFSPDTWPPNPVFVDSVEIGGWSHKGGVEQGDRLVRVNGQLAHEMEKKELKRAMRARPLELTFVKPTDDETPRDTSTIGSRPLSPMKAASSSQLQDTSAMAVVLRAGDMERAALRLQRIFRGHQGRKVAKDKKEERNFYTSWDNITPSYTKEQTGGKTESKKRVEVNYYPQMEIDFKFEGGGTEPAIVTKVAPEGHAERLGLRPGFKLVLIGGKETTSLTKEELKKRLKNKRPLSLTFIHGKQKVTEEKAKGQKAMDAKEKLRGAVKAKKPKEDGDALFNIFRSAVM